MHMNLKCRQLLEGYIKGFRRFLSPYAHYKFIYQKFVHLLHFLISCCDTHYINVSLLKDNVFVQHQRKNVYYHHNDCIKLKNSIFPNFKAYIFQIVDDVIIQNKYSTILYKKTM